MNPPRAGRRETAKAERREAILNATLALIDDPRAEHASVEAIARQAGVAPATIYNLFGSRDKILVCLVRRMAVDPVDVEQSDQHLHPLAPLLMPIDLVCAHFGERPRAWSHIILRLGDIAAKSPSESNAPEFGALLEAQWREVQNSGVIHDSFAPAALALQTYATVNGALLRWAAERISLDALRLLLRHTILVISAATAQESYTSAFAEELRTIGTQLSSALGEPTSS